jgi:outer membrane protein assembly factor BamB
MMKSITPLFPLVLFSVTAWADWPNWRGPHHDGSSTETILPETLSLTEGIAWRVALPGPAASTPIVSGDAVFVTTTDPAAKKLIALCFDRKTGRESWRKEIGDGYSSDERSNFANPSPVTDGKTVIFHFSTGDTAAFDFSGKEIWRKQMEKEYGPYAIQWTPATSPVIVKDQVIFQVLQRDSSFVFGDTKKGNPSGPNESYLVSLNVADGTQRWKHIRPSDAAAESLESFSTPMPWASPGRDELLVTGGDTISGHQLTDGKELWRAPSWNAQKISHWRLVPGPVAGDGVILACAPKREPVYAFKSGINGLAQDADRAWTSGDTAESKDVSSDVSTPLFYKGRFYILNSDRKSLSCVEPKTGKVIWDHRIEGSAKIEASPTAGADKIYFQDHRGKVMIMAAADSPKEIASLAMGEGEQKDVRASIALSNGCLFIRNASHLICVGQP